MRQRRWLELIKDCDCEINYHPGKANVVADALSKKSMVELAALGISQPWLIKELTGMGLEVVGEGIPVHLANLMVQLELLARIKAAQLEDPECAKIKQLLAEGKAKEFYLKEDGLLTHLKQVCVPGIGRLRKEIISEAHHSPYTVHPGGTKIYHEVKWSYRWNNMKDIAKFVEQCSTCQQVKAEHQRPTWTLKPLLIPKWKWDKITMNFILGLPKTSTGEDSIWVVVDQLMKSAHFILIKVKDPMDKLARLFVQNVVCLHGLPSTIISNRDSHFTLRFWQSLQKKMGTELMFSTTFHPQIDGLSERTNQILEDMLRACVLEFKGSWVQYLPLIKFAYNNSYQATIRMPPYEALYGRKC
jgi:hypothetical protein